MPIKGFQLTGKVSPGFGAVGQHMAAHAGMKQNMERSGVYS